jgi:hypothetical protein
MKWLDKILGLDFPPPEVGQVWRSGHSKRRMRVSRVLVTDSGDLLIHTEPELGGGGWGMGGLYAMGLSDWKRSLKRERRTKEWDEVELARFGLKPSDYEGR